MVSGHGRHSSTFRLPSKQKKQKKSVLSIYYTILKIHQQLVLVLTKSPNNSDMIPSQTPISSMTFKIPLVEVAAGMMRLNHQIIYYLQDTLNLLPDLSDTSITHWQSFASSTNVGCLFEQLAKGDCASCVGG